MTTNVPENEEVHTFKIDVVHSLAPARDGNTPPARHMVSAAWTVTRRSTCIQLRRGYLLSIYLDSSITQNMTTT